MNEFLLAGALVGGFWVMTSSWKSQEQDTPKLGPPDKVVWLLPASDKVKPLGTPDEPKPKPYKEEIKYVENPDDEPISSIPEQSKENLKKIEDLRALIRKREEFVTIARQNLAKAKTDSERTKWEVNYARNARAIEDLKAKIEAL